MSKGANDGYLDCARAREHAAHLCVLARAHEPKVSEREIQCGEECRRSARRSQRRQKRRRERRPETRRCAREG